MDRRLLRVQCNGGLGRNNEIISKWNSQRGQSEEVREFTGPKNKSDSMTSRYPPLNNPHIPLNNPPPPQIHRLLNPDRLFREFLPTV